MARRRQQRQTSSGSCGTTLMMSVSVVCTPVVFTSSTSLVRATNHGGIAAVAFTGARLELLDIGAMASTFEFEFACVRVSSGAVSYIVCAVYRPGSATVSATFFVDLTDVLDRLATSVEPLFVTSTFTLSDLLMHHPFSSSTCLPRKLTTSVVCSILLHPAMIYRRHLSKSLTSVCQTIGLSDGQF